MDHLWTLTGKFTKLLSSPGTDRQPTEFATPDTSRTVQPFTSSAIKAFSNRARTWSSVKHSTLPNDFLSPVDGLVARHLTKELENVDLDVADVVQSIEESYHTGNQDQDDDQSTADDLARQQQSMEAREMFMEQLKEATKLLEKGWSYDTILVYLKLARRGHEPLYPYRWHWDYPRFPPNLFVSANSDLEPFVRSIERSPFGGNRAFDRLCMMGQEVRTILQSQYSLKTPEHIMFKCINEYIKWAWKDVNLYDAIQTKAFPSILVIVRNREPRGIKPKEELLANKLQSKLRNASVTLLEAITPKNPQLEDPDYLIVPPTIFGLIISSTVIAVAAYEPLNEKGEMRSIAFYAFNKIEEETWNAISLSILFSWIRYGMIRIRDALIKQNGGNPFFIPASESDPDL